MIIRGNRIVVAGIPRAGKTTLAGDVRVKLGHRVMHTDDLIGELDWSSASDAVLRWLDEPEPWVIEGVAAVRALRKWLIRNPEGKPCDMVVWCGRPYVTVYKNGQRAMAKGCERIWGEIRGELLARGVEVVSNSLVDLKG